MPVHPKEVSIGTISGGIVNFGGAVNIFPISVTTTAAGSGSGNRGQAAATNSRLTPAVQQGLTDIIGFIGRGFK